MYMHSPSKASSSHRSPSLVSSWGTVSPPSSSLPSPPCAFPTPYHGHPPAIGRSSNYPRGTEPFSPDSVESYAPNLQTPRAPSLGSVELPQPTPHSVPLSLSDVYSSSGLHRVLAYDPSGRLSFNIDLPPPSIAFRSQFTYVQPNHQAFNPPTTRVGLNVPYFPGWSFEVANRNGVTLNDIITNISHALNRRVEQLEFMSFHQRLQATGTAAFQARCQRSAEPLAMRRRDFLVPNLWFVGLSLATDGSGRWDVRLVPAIAP